ncbi:MAG: hypothetical protein KC416_09675 [Myxococcales bacterium]|nr:hypothetical protein [Myxococcales bacterium]
MITVAIIGILASVGMMTFEGFIRRTREAERSTLIGTLSRNLRAYYHSPGSGEQGLGATSQSHCRASDPDNFGDWPVMPTPGKKTFIDFATNQSFRSIGMIQSGYYYNSVMWFSAAGNEAYDNGGCGLTDLEGIYQIMSATFTNTGRLEMCETYLHARNGEIMSQGGLFCDLSAEFNP